MIFFFFFLLQKTDILYVTDVQNDILSEFWVISTSEPKYPIIVYMYLWVVTIAKKSNKWSVQLMENPSEFNFLL